MKYIIVCLIISAQMSYAHSGRTDAHGGHNGPNGYHYHNNGALKGAAGFAVGANPAVGGILAPNRKIYGPFYSQAELNRHLLTQKMEKYNAEVAKLPNPWLVPNTPVNHDTLWKFRFQQASNGLPSFQYDVGCYYRTNGDSTNALYWLTKSAAQGNLQAKKEIASMETKKSD